MFLIGVFLLASGLTNAAPKSEQTKILNLAQKYLEMGTITYVYGGSEDDGLDCSHFIQRVFTEAGVPFPYINTALMLELSPEKLRRNYHLLHLGLETQRIQPTDFLVYRGHVVMVENISKPGRGDILHATGGRDIRGPGQGVQRERNVDFSSFRGPLLAIIRHEKLNFDKMVVIKTEQEKGSGPHPKLRKIPNRN